MKIGISTFGGDGGKSGISRYIMQLLKEFVHYQDKHSFEVITYPDEKSLFIPEASDFSSLCITENIRKPIKNILWHQTSLFKYAKKYDILFLPAANRRVPLFKSCKTVGTVHDFSSIHVKGKYDFKRDYYIKKVLPFLIRRLDHVLTVSESSKKDIVKFAQVPSDKVMVTPLAADKKIYFPMDKSNAKEKVKENYGIDSPYLLYISRIEHPGKNHVRLVKAFDSLKQQMQIPHKLVLAGSDWSGAEHVHQETKKLSHFQDIIFTGFVPEDHLPFLYNGCDLFVFPSLYEGFGLPVLEAMSCKVPVICSNISSLPEVAGSAALMFDPYNEQNIRETLIKIIENDVLKNKCISDGWEHVQNFSWQKVAQQTMNIFEKVYNS